MKPDLQENWKDRVVGREGGLGKQNAIYRELQALKKSDLWIKHSRNDGTDCSRRKFSNLLSHCKGGSFAPLQEKVKKRGLN